MRVNVESGEDSQLMAHAERELRAAGLFDADSDYGGDIGHSVMALVAVLSSQGHSGESAMQTLHAFSRVSLYKPLTPITSNPDEWFMPLTGGEESDGTVSRTISMWQSKRQPDLFSYDGGKTWNSVDDSRWRRKWDPLAWLWRRHWRNLQQKAGA